MTLSTSNSSGKSVIDASKIMNAFTKVKPMTIIVIVICLLSACQQEVLTPPPTSDPSMIPWWERENLPDFIGRVQPAPGGFVLQAATTNSIYSLVSLDRNKLILPESDSNWDEHIQVSINDARIPVETHTSLNEEWLNVSGKLPSELGHYTATIQVTQLPPRPMLEYS